MLLIIIVLNTAAFLFACAEGLPRPFPWMASAALGWLLLLGALASPLLKIERAVGFVTLLSSMIVTAHVLPHVQTRHVRQLLTVIAALLSAFILADALRLIPTEDVAFTSGETFGWIRRPYLLEHPNVKASWLLLLSLSPITLAGVMVAQSRGALLGYLAACARFIPRRHYATATLAGAIVIGVAAFIRPETFFGRVDLWADGLRIFMDHPLFGAGTGSFHSLTTTGMATAHNALITIAAENGVLGLAATIAWLAALVPLITRSPSTMKFNLLAFAVQQMVDDQWLHVVSSILLGVVIALCLFQREQ
jgi:O-antigen ligase